MIKIEIVNRNNKKTDITQLVEKVTWSGDYKQASRKLEFSIISNKYDKKIPQVDIQEGYMVFFYEDKEELFRGFVYTIEKTTDKTSYLAYDHAQKLVHTKINYNFKNMTAKQITEKMLDDYSQYGIKKGSIVSDGVPWSKVFIGVSMYDTIMSAYTNSHASNGKEYMCYAKKGKIHTALKGDIKLNIQFKEGENIISTTYKSTIENVINRVIIVDDAGNQIGEEKNSKSIELYGLFQEIVKAGSKTTELTTEITETTTTDPDTGEEIEKPGPSPSTGDFIWPVPSVHKISSPFGPRKAPAPGASTFHKGIDIPGSVGTPIKAADGGKVVVAKIGYNGGRGNYIVIDHGNGTGSLYQHLQSFSVKVGQSVSQGQEIAKMGNTGISTGAHLHFEIHECFSGTKGTPVNPQKYVSSSSSSKASKSSSISSASSAATKVSTSTSNSYTLNTTNSVAKAIFDFCIAKGCTPQVACGIVANAECESSFNTKSVNSIGASGLLQWLGGRLSSLKSKASKKGVSWTNLNLQLEHMWDELSGEESTTVSALNNRVGGLSKFMKLTDPYKAGYEFGKCFERGGYNEKRGSTAKTWYSKVVAGGNEIKDSDTTTDKTQTDAIETVTMNTTNDTVTDLEGAKEEAKKMLTGRERSASLDGYGDPTCITGYGVTVTDSSTGLKGLFYIDTDSHTWENGEYKIQLNLNYKNLMNEVTAGEDEQQVTITDSITDTTTDSITDSDSTEKVLNGKKVKAIFTAYWPGPGIEGGPYQSMGGRLDPSKKTCAAPKCIPFRTKIQPSGTGSFIDGKTYTVTDRGGKINVVNGVYHIDILMSTDDECDKFGVKHGYIIIGDGTGYKTPAKTTPRKDEKPSAKAKKLISVAKSKLGAPYVWGASGTKSFDCSSFTQYVYKTALGINLQRTSNVQGEQGKKITSVSALQPGDLIYFNTYSTERANGITHVGMYIGNGQMIHASYSQKKVVIQNLKPYLAYKGTKFIWARRHI